MVEASVTITALTYNAHLFGQTARFFVNGSLRETDFYFHDAERVPQIGSSVLGTGADIVGLTEIWDDDTRERLLRELSGRYPYAATSPSAPGIGRLLERTYEGWPRLAPRIDGAVGHFTRRHYSVAKTGLATGLAEYLSPYLTEDRIGRALSAILRSGPVWGAGLLFLSRYPIVSSLFLPHPVRADWEHLAGKGVLWSLVELPNGSRVRVSLGHYQEGESAKAREARGNQIDKTRKALEFFARPTLCLGDFNVIGGTPEYDSMLSSLGLADSGKGPTYRDPNPYQEKLGAPRPERPQARQLDYILHGPEWTALESSVPRDDFWSSEGGFHLSDHDPVLTRVRLDDTARRGS
ncbi:MAG TPA: endonuclease/exonuclease/phosphatase family protein [bacterium]|nr:endonuclease/exonuclease/phosphatase family protein [bacterium]